MLLVNPAHFPNKPVWPLFNAPLNDFLLVVDLFVILHWILEGSEQIRLKSNSLSLGRCFSKLLILARHCYAFINPIILGCLIIYLLFPPHLTRHLFLMENQVVELFETGLLATIKRKCSLVRNFRSTFCCDIAALFRKTSWWFYQKLTILYFWLDLFYSNLKLLVLILRFKILSIIRWAVRTWSALLLLLHRVLTVYRLHSWLILLMRFAETLWVS